MRSCWYLCSVILFVRSCWCLYFVFVFMLSCLVPLLSSVSVFVLSCSCLFFVMFMQKEGAVFVIILMHVLCNFVNDAV